MSLSIVTKYLTAMVLSLSLALTCMPAMAATEPGAAEASARVKAFNASLHPQHGTIRIAEADAQLVLGDNYYFLGKEDARQVIVDAWGNPPDQADGVLGLIVPAGKTVFDEWAAVVTFERDGYISDKDADKTDYDSFLKEIQKGEPEQNRKRVSEGYPALHMVGWAQPPSYDRAGHSMIWASELEIDGNAEHTLNYDVRLLGRHGVLSINVVSGMTQLPVIRESARTLATVAAYDAGATYSDYKSGDTKAAYTVGGMVAAGLGLAAAKKFGLLAILLLIVKKGWIVIVAVAGGVWSWLRGLVGKKPASPVRRPSAFDSEPVVDETTDAAANLAAQAPSVEEASRERRSILDKD